jgi:exosortase A-associated hydrolase 2
MAVESPFFFGGSRDRRFAMWHAPGAPVRGDVFVLCHPFGEEKLWAHRVLVSFARELASRGHAVLRFDYRGNGDSDGEFADSSVSSALEDLNAAIDVARERTGASSVGLVGLRWGATLASQAAEARQDVGTLVLWAPIVDGSRYVQELLRINLTTQMSVFREIRWDRATLAEQLREGRTANVDGYDLSLRMHDELSQVNLVEGSKGFAGRCLIVQIERSQPVRPGPDLEALCRQYPSASLMQVEEDPFWREIERFYDRAPNLFARTLEWLAAC